MPFVVEAIDRGAFAFIALGFSCPAKLFLEQQDFQIGRVTATSQLCLWVLVQKVVLILQNKGTYESL